MFEKKHIEKQPLPEENFMEKMKSDPSPYFKQWRYAAWRVEMARNGSSKPT